MRYSIFMIGLCCLLFAACSSKSGTETTGATGAATIENTDAKGETAQPEGRYKAGDVLYCHAKSGLVLRDKPDQAGAKLASVPIYGKVEIKDDAPFELAFSVKEACGMEIKGFWVKASFAGKEGYLFDGYLLKDRPLGDEETVEDYWTSIAKVKSSTDKPPHSDVEYYVYNKTAWENGVSYENSGYEGGSNSVLILPKGMYSFQEAYLLATSGLMAGPDNPFTCTCNEGKQKVECKSKDELAFTDLETDDKGNFVITDSYAD